MSTRAKNDGSIKDRISDFSWNYWNTSKKLSLNAQNCAYFVNSPYFQNLSQTRYPAGPSGLFQTRTRTRPGLKIRRPVDHYVLEISRNPEQQQEQQQQQLLHN